MGDEATIYIMPDATEFRLDDTDSRRYLNAVSGLGMPAVRYTTRKGYGQDGETYISSRLNSRAISMKITEAYASRQAMWEGHLAWFRALVPGDDAGVLRKVFPDGSTYDLAVRFQKGLDAPGDARLGNRAQSYALQLVAHDPIWKDPIAKSSSGVSSAGLQRVFPYYFPYYFDGNTIMDAISIAYGGSWRSWPTITLTGPMTAPLIRHIERGVSIRLLDAIQVGYTVVIDLDPEQPIATHSGDAVMRWSDDTDMAGFYLVSGTNTIQVQAAAMAAPSQAEVAYYERFIAL